MGDHFKSGTLFKVRTVKKFIFLFEDSFCWAGKMRWWECQTDRMSFAKQRISNNRSNNIKYNNDNNSKSSIKYTNSNSKSSSKKRNLTRHNLFEKTRKQNILLDFCQLLQNVKILFVCLFFICSCKKYLQSCQIEDPSSCPITIALLFWARMVLGSETSKEVQWVLLAWVQSWCF